MLSFPNLIRAAIKVWFKKMVSEYLIVWNYNGGSLKGNTSSPWDRFRSGARAITEACFDILWTCPFSLQCKMANISNNKVFNITVRQLIF